MFYKDKMCIKSISSIVNDDMSGEKTNGEGTSWECKKVHRILTDAHLSSKLMRGKKLLKSFINNK